MPFVKDNGREPDYRARLAEMLAHDGCGLDEVHELLLEADVEDCDVRAIYQGVLDDPRFAEPGRTLPTMDGVLNTRLAPGTPDMLTLVELIGLRADLRRLNREGRGQFGHLRKQVEHMRSETPSSAPPNPDRRLE